MIEEALCELAPDGGNGIDDGLRAQARHGESEQPKAPDVAAKGEPALTESGREGKPVLTCAGEHERERAELVARDGSADTGGLRNRGFGRTTVRTTSNCPPWKLNDSHIVGGCGSQSSVATKSVFDHVESVMYAPEDVVRSASNISSELVSWSGESLNVRKREDEKSGEAGSDSVLEVGLEHRVIEGEICCRRDQSLSCIMKHRPQILT